MTNKQLESRSLTLNCIGSTLMCISAPLPNPWDWIPLVPGFICVFVAFLLTFKWVKRTDPRRHRHD